MKQDFQTVNLLRCF